MSAPTFDIAEIRRMAAAYPDAAAFTRPETRERHFTAKQQLAWTLRFERDPERRADALLAISGMGEAPPVDAAKAPTSTPKAGSGFALGHSDRAGCVQ